MGERVISMVNGDDIANADNLLKQIKDKKDYIYKNLLKGPYGCEVFLQNTSNIKPFPSAGSGVRGTDWSNFNVNSVKRTSYPSAILYDYNNFIKDEILPDPWQSGKDSTKMTANDKNSVYGPGFLSFVKFSAEAGDNDSVRGSERLTIHDLLPLGHSNNAENRHKHIGNMTQVGEDKGGPFETMIGVY